VRLVREGAILGGLDEAHVETAESEAAAIRRALGLAQAGDLVVLQVDDVKQAFTLLEEARGRGARPQRRPRPRAERPDGGAVPAYASAEDLEAEAVAPPGSL